LFESREKLTPQDDVESPGVRIQPGSEPLGALRFLIRNYEVDESEWPSCRKLHSDSAVSGQFVKLAPGNGINVGERARRLQQLVGETVDVVALIFTQSDPVRSDLAAANEHRIILVGRKDIQALLDLLMTNGTTEDALTFLTPQPPPAGLQLLLEDNDSQNGWSGD